MSTPEQKYEQWFRETKALYDVQPRPPINRKKLAVRSVTATFCALCIGLFARDRCGGWSQESVRHILKGSIYKGAEREKVTAFLMKQQNRYWGIEYKIHNDEMPIKVRFNTSSWPLGGYELIDYQWIEVELVFYDKQRLILCAGQTVTLGGDSGLAEIPSNPFECD